MRSLGLSIIYTIGHFLSSAGNTSEKKNGMQPQLLQVQIPFPETSAAIPAA